MNFKKTIGTILTIALLTIASRSHAAGSISLITDTLPAAAVNAPYNATISFAYSGTGKPTVSTSTLPKGVTINSYQNAPILVYNNGIYSFNLTGLPQTAGNYSINFVYSDQMGGSTAVQSLELTVQSTFNIDGFTNLNGTILPEATTGQPYAFEFGILYSGNQTPSSTIQGLPVGITASPIYQYTDHYQLDLQGTPLVAGTYSVLLTLGDQTVSVPYTLTLKVDQGTSVQKSNPDGTNILSPNGTVSMVVDGTQRPYTSAGAFLSYGFNSWVNVVPSSVADSSLPVGSFIPPRDGSIICSDRGSDKGTCYLITDGEKAGFTSSAAFTGLGFSFTKSTSGDVSWMISAPFITSPSSQHVSGTLINNEGTFELVQDQGYLGVPDESTLESWGYSFSDAVLANASDKLLVQTGILPIKTAGQLKP